MRFLIIKTHALGIGVAAAVAVARATETGSGPRDDTFTLSLVAPPPQPVVLWQRFDSAFTDKANGIFSDALQPLNVVRWNVELRGKDFSDNFRARASSAARGAFTRTFQYSAREAVVELPFMVWLDENDRWLADILRGSIGNVNEESAAPLDITHGGFQEARWRNEASRGTDYGIRPLRMNPYAYVSHGFNDGERTVLLAHVRYYYDHFADHRVELGVSMPLEYGMALDFGHSYQFGTHDQQRLTLKLIKELNGGNGIAHVGFEIRQHPALIAGLTLVW